MLDDPRRPSRPRCAFAGLGSWGRRLLARVAPAFDVVALVGSGRPESVASSVRNYPDVPYLDTLAKALALPALEAVFLARPTPTHAELASQALEAVCDVFVELRSHSRWTLVTRFVCWPRPTPIQTVAISDSARARFVAARR